MHKIPHTDDPQRYTPLCTNNEPFVQLTNEDGFDIKMQYPLLGMDNAESRCLVREEVFHKLQAAQNLLPDGYKLRIWDAWRPFALQNELFEKYKQDIIATFALSSKTEEERNAVIAKFVSPPNNDVFISPVHTTGGSVDVTLIDRDGNELNMGTAFDAFTDRTQTDYFEIHNENEEIRNNRRMLYHCMTQAGFTNLPSEWWHFDYGNRFWAYYKACPAVYEGVFESGNIRLK